MTITEIESTCSFRCSHCQNGEEPFSNFQSQKSIPAKIWVKNLPQGLSESGLKNLFITIGKPKCINYFLSSNTAIVEFDCLKKAELSVRDLHCKPPYNLKVTTAIYDTNQSTEDLVEEKWDFSNAENVLDNLFQGENNTKEKNDKLEKAKKQLREIVTKFGYDPSIRMRQKKLDYKTDSNCVSIGRGYLNMDKMDRYIGGLQNCVATSKNSKAKDEVNFTCHGCKAPTTKMCGNCLKPYCSKFCLSKSQIDHKGKCSTLKNDSEKQSVEKASESSPDLQNSCNNSKEYSFFNGELTNGCTVIMTTFLTMDSVFVRRADKEREEKFTRLCNDVAEFALKEDKLQSMPKVGELYIAKYYKDSCYYRARVTAVCQTTVDVVFVDFGNSQETKYDELKPLPDYLKSVPELAVKVHLSDMTEGSTLESVDYFNKLTAERIPLVLEFKNEWEEVVLIEKESKTVVNETASNYALPSWKVDSSVLSKNGEIFFKSSLTTTALKVGDTYSLKLCHFDEKEFLDSDVLWASWPGTDEFIHVNSEMHERITEYCEYLKNDYYLPRTNELCLVKEKGKWHRCLNLKSQKTLCCLFFVDDGHSSFIESCNIRKMIQDFTEVPAQAICCTLPDDSKIKADKVLCSKVVEYLKTCVGQTIDSVRILKMMGDAFCLSIPEIQKMLA